MDILRIARGRFSQKVLAEQPAKEATDMIISPAGEEPGSVILYTRGEQYDYHVRLSPRDVMGLRQIIADHPEFYFDWMG